MCLRLLQEPGGRQGAAFELRVEQLDGHLATGDGVARSQDDPHAAAADNAQDVESAQAGEGARDGTVGPGLPPPAASRSIVFDRGTASKSPPA